VASPGPPDRGLIRALRIPFKQNSDVLNKVRFSLRDAAGNLGLSPVYSVRIQDATPPAPATAFSAVASYGQITLSWHNPTTPDLAGTMIRVATGDYPANCSDGTLVVDRLGTPGGYDSFVHTGLSSDTTYYYAAFAHDAVLNYATASPAEATTPAGGDFDGDADADLGDFTFFQLCFNGPNRPSGAGCGAADFDTDGDVDLTDFAVFQSCFNGPNRLPACR
jgi:hypothetical protein